MGIRQHKYTEYEITNQEEYEILKKKNLQVCSEKFEAEAQKIDEELAEFAAKCVKKLIAMEALKAQIKPDDEGYLNWEIFMDVASTLLLLLPHYRYYTIARGVFRGARLLMRMGKLTKDEGPPPVKDAFIIKEPIKPHPTDRTIPKDLHEQIALGALKTLEKKDCKVMATRNDIRDIKKIESWHGKGNWER